jgi:predicted MFS family arabinose efflux permease
MEVIRPQAEALLAPLRHSNFRLFFSGQLVSMVGTWMQVVGQAWLVLEVTHSAFLLGVTNALQWSPTLLLSLPAGVLADRIPKRTLVIATQTASLLLAGGLGLLTVLGWVRYWHIAAAATLLGIVSAIDVPARQALIIELVEGSEDLTGAVALNSALFNSARLIGPSLAGLVIAAWGAGVAFLANAVSFLAVIWALVVIRTEPADTVAPGVSLLRGVREGVRFVRHTPPVLWVFIVLGILALFPMNFELFVPVLARTQLRVGAAGFGFLMAIQGAGALVGALGVAAMGRAVPRWMFLLWGAIILCCATMALGLARDAVTAGILLFVAGGSMIAFTVIANSTTQVETPDVLKGRVMSLYNLVYNGTTPPGALLIGWLIEAVGLPAALGITGGIGLFGTVGIYAGLLRRRRTGSGTAS